MNSLELEFPLKTKVIDHREFILDPVRKKYVLLTPEEWVRQHVLYLLNHKMGIPYSRIAVERQVKGSKKRFDILIHDQATGYPVCIIECKSKTEQVGQKTLEQISRYNKQLKVPYLVVTNWTVWIAAEVNENSFEFLNQFPELS